MSRTPIVLPLFAILLDAGCGYRIGSLSSIREVRVKLFDNVTERRLHEFELTRRIIQELGHAGIRVHPDADHELSGEIVAFHSPVLAEGPLDETLVGSISVRVRFRLINRSTGRTVWEDTASSAASFTGLRGKPAESARQEVFRRLAEAIASKFESGW